MQWSNKNGGVTKAIEKLILDACCGSRMFWFDKENADTVYMDCREFDTELCDGRRLVVSPDVMGDFRNMPFDDETFRLVVFDPPHLVRLGEKSWTAKKYGVLQKTWQQDIKQGFDECMRVLEPNGVLIFKWNEEQIKLAEILKLIPYKPLFGDKRSKTHWLVFMKRNILTCEYCNSYKPLEQRPSAQADNEKKGGK